MSVDAPLDTAENIPRVKKYRYCDSIALEKIRDEVSAKINDLIFIRENDDRKIDITLRKSFYNYSVLQRLYSNAKNVFLGSVRKGAEQLLLVVKFGNCKTK